MKYLKVINILPISFFIFALLALPAMAATHSITGNIYTDWGVNLSKAYSDDSDIDSNNNPISYDGWKPKDSSVDWIVENNIGKQYHTLQYSYGGYDLFNWAGSKYGTHKMKTGTSDSISDYDEPTIYCEKQKTFYIQPAGAEAYDIEALYFDDDSKYAYFTIVTSLPEDGTTDSSHTKMGDIALDIYDTKGSKLINGTTVPYEFGIKVLDYGKFKSGNIVYQPNWTIPDVNDFPDDYPFTIASGNVVGSADLWYNESTSANLIPRDNGLPNSVIEVRILRSLIGNPSKDQLSNIHVTIGCGNDVIELTPVRFKSDIPEFPSIALPVAAIMGVMFIFGRRNKE